VYVSKHRKFLQVPLEVVEEALGAQVPEGELTHGWGLLANAVDKYTTPERC